MLTKFSPRIVTIVAASALLATTAVALVPTPAFAEANGGGKDKGKDCTLMLNPAAGYNYPPGTKITVKNSQTGATETFVCDGKTGEWVHAEAFRVITLPALELRSGAPTASF